MRPAPRASRPAPPPPPRSIGKFEEWTAATHQEAGQTVCYAFTRAVSSSPPLPGRGDVVLTVTQRPGGVRDAVAISAGFAYAPNAEVSLQVDQTNLSFYTAQRSAFARDGHAAVLAFAHGRQAVAKSPSLRNTVVTDTFSLRGFSPAFAAVNKACSVKG
ncbi:MAG: invasion associated locus B family protein [Acetobacteraceae bacterium]